MIKVELEPGPIGDYGGVVENCVLCGQRTRYWHRQTNNPVCSACAKRRKVSELKNWLKPKI
jgi:hypothetical protein